MACLRQAGPGMVDAARHYKRPAHATQAKIVEKPTKMGIFGKDVVPG
jgi:hypothetical protein